MNSELDAATKDMQDKVAPKFPGRVRWLSLPEDGKSAEWLVDELNALKDLPASEWAKGKVSGAVYHGGEDMEKVIADAFAKFVISNPLHPDVFPGPFSLPSLCVRRLKIVLVLTGVRKMEAEIISMVLNIYNAPPSGVGCMTSGGTESILMACKAYRDWAYETKGITEPEMVIPISAHAAFDKAGEYFGIKVNHVKVSPETRRVNIHSIGRAINKNTIMVRSFLHHLLSFAHSLLVADRRIGTKLSGRGRRRHLFPITLGSETQDRPTRRLLPRILPGAVLGTGRIPDGSVRFQSTGGDFDLLRYAQGTFFRL